MNTLKVKEEIIKKEVQNNEKVYVDIKNQITNWPEWKKQAFNINFATSAHSKKIEI